MARHGTAVCPSSEVKVQTGREGPPGPLQLGTGTRESLFVAAREIRQGTLQMGSPSDP